MTEYILYNPTGNITALVTSTAAPEERAGIAREILRRADKVEASIPWLSFNSNSLLYIKSLFFISPPKKSISQLNGNIWKNGKSINKEAVFRNNSKQSIKRS